MAVNRRLKMLLELEAFSHIVESSYEIMRCHGGLYVVKNSHPLLDAHDQNSTYESRKG